MQGPRLVTLDSAAFEPGVRVLISWLSMSLEPMSPETVLDNLVFPEGPRWHDGELYFSDQHDRIVWAIAPSGKPRRIADVPQQPSGLGWLPDGTLQIVSMHDRRLLRLTPAGLTVVADLAPFAPGYINDMVIDRHGRAYVGNFGFDLIAAEPVKSTVLLMVALDGTVSVACDDVCFPNGTVITPDGKTLLLAETFAARITAFEIQSDGQLGNRRVFADLPGIHPDGTCLDAEGGLWVACAGGNKVIRVVDGGRVTHEIPLAGRHAYACMLGGADRRDLYLCTAADYRPEVTFATRSGRIEVVRVDIPGAGLP
jgi:sugar lactone lactonase YvrE